MSHSYPCAIIMPLSLMLPGCMSLGTNVAGDFACRAPKGTCAPTRVIDAATGDNAARNAETQQHTSHEYGLARQRAGAAPGDPARTGERTLRVVFPAHVDELGVLHDQAVAWIVVEAPQWAAQLRGAASSQQKLSLPYLQSEAAPRDSEDEPLARDFSNSFELAAPPVLPSTVGAAGNGAQAPEAGGSAMVATPHDRISRPRTLNYPSAAAINEAAGRSDIGKSQPPAGSAEEGEQ